MISRSREGTVLIIVAGIATLMLSVSVAFLVRMRADGEESAFVIHDSSARIMLTNALAYVAETSRLGWGDETFGWNDVHDHSIGPSWFLDSDGDGVGEVTPVWTAGSWPAPGSAARCPMYVMERPPRAIRQDLGFNPVAIVAAGQTVPELGYTDGPGQNLTAAGGATIDTLGRSRMADFSALDPQPVASTRLDFELGDTAARIESLGLGWFRVYRETEADHDGDRSPWYDTIDLNGGSYVDTTPYPNGNASVFVITAGSGATQGYRFWSLAPSDPRRAVEPVTAEESGLFQTQDQFESLRAEERVLWFRIEWSPLVGDQSGKNTYHGSGQVYAPQNHWVQGGDIWGHDIVRSQFGSIRWIQRLDREPEQW